MKRFLLNFGRTLTFMVLIALTGALAHAQGGSTTSSLSGLISDSTRANVPGASVVAKNKATGAENTTVSDGDGRFFIPALEPGVYRVTIALSGFKTAILSDVKILASTPATVRATLEVGGMEEAVTVMGATEILQTQTAAVTTTLTTQQISNIPLATRNTMDFLAMLPGVSTTGQVRNSTVMGLRPSATNITIDGVNVQDNYLKSSDGFFARINPRLDAVEEVTMTSAGAGADASGQGAVQIQFVTRSGTNQLQASVYWFRRRPNWNTPYWFNERDGLPKDALDVDTYGFRIGGPIVLPKIFDGHEKAFFFVNLEEFRLPGSISRNRTIMTPQAQQGVFRYNSASGVQSINLLQLAAQNGHLATVDPAVARLLAAIRTSTGTTGTLADLTDPNLQRYSFINQSEQIRRYPTMRLDFNVSKNHRIGLSSYYQQYLSQPDTLNGVDPAFPGFPNTGGQNSNRYSIMANWRGVLRPNVINELRVAGTGGPVSFSDGISKDQFTDTGGFAPNISSFAGISNGYVSRNPNTRDAPTYSIDNTLSWTRGSHNLRMGATFTKVDMSLESGNLVPTLTFGVDSADPASAMFNATNFQGASATDLTNARNLYAVLTGRVTSINGAALLDGNTGKYVYMGRATQRGTMREAGFFVQDQWRLRPNLTLNAGVRYELQFPLEALNDYYSTAASADQLYGVSGPGNLFKPGTLTGSPTRFVLLKKGQKAYDTDLDNIAPSFGLAWTPRARSGFLGKLMGEEGDFAIRAGYSKSFNREGMATFANIFSFNPGGQITVTRSTALGNIGQALPLLLRSGNLGPPAFGDAPSYPLTPQITESVNIFDPKTEVPYTHSFSAGLQRALGKNTAIELRYVGTRGRNGWINGGRNYNEINIRENGFLEEFKLAMANLQSNIAAGRGNTFRYFGAGSGTSPLPTFLAFFAGVPANRAADPSLYTSTNFTNSTFVGFMAPRNPAPTAMAGYLWGNTNSTAAFRANALSAGLPSNLFVVNPDLLGGAFVTTNDQLSSNYDALQFELRRRFTSDLLISANYALASAKLSSFYTLREKAEMVDSGATLKHAVKMNWVYGLPFGKGKKFVGEAGSALDRIIGGWEWSGSGRVQSGQVFDFGNVRLVGMDDAELRKIFKVYQRPDATGKTRVYMLPQEVIDNSLRAFNVSATSPDGYSGLGAPTGRYFAPANGIDCIQVVAGDCAPRHHFVTGPMFVRFDMSLVKKIPLVRRLNMEFRVDALNVFDNINFMPGTASGAYAGATSANYEVQAAYRDINNTQDPGGRVLQFSTRISW